MQPHMQRNCFRVPFQLKPPFFCTFLNLLTGKNDVDLVLEDEQPLQLGTEDLVVILKAKLKSCKTQMYIYMFTFFYFYLINDTPMTFFIYPDLLDKPLLLQAHFENIFSNNIIILSRQRDY